MCIISETMYLCGHSSTILVLCKYEDPIEYDSVDNDADGINHIWPFRYGDIRLGPCRAGKQVFKGKKKDEPCPTCGNRSFRRWCTEKRRRRIGDKKWERSMLNYSRQMAKRAREAKEQAETEKTQSREKKQKQETIVEEKVLVMTKPV